MVYRIMRIYFIIINVLILCLQFLFQFYFMPFMVYWLIFFGGVHNYILEHTVTNQNLICWSCRFDLLTTIAGHNGDIRLILLHFKGLILSAL